MPVFDASMVAGVTMIVLLVRLGQGLLVVGSVRSKNAASSGMRLILDLAVVTLALWAVGAAFVPAIGSGQFFSPWHLLGIEPEARVAFRLLPTLIIATGAVHGAVAERSRLGPILVVSGLLAALVVPVVGYLAVEISTRTQVPIIDHGAGLGSVIGGAVALVAALVVGPRKGKFNRDLSCNFVPGHNVTFQLVGVMVLTLGFALLADSAQVLLGVSAAAVAGAAFGRLRFGKVDTGLTLSATIAGLCAVATAGGPSWAAVLTGAIAGVIAPWLVIFVETRLRIDDVTGSITSYLFGGVLGFVAAALLQYEATASQRFASLVANLAFVAVALAVAAPMAWGVFSIMRKRNAVRLTEGAEFDGADLSELDLNAYPDFQQTTIKSYHLREL